MINVLIVKPLRNLSSDFGGFLSLKPVGTRSIPGLGVVHVVRSFIVDQEVVAPVKNDEGHQGGGGRGVRELRRVEVQRVPAEPQSQDLDHDPESPARIKPRPGRAEQFRENFPAAIVARPAAASVDPDELGPEDVAEHRVVAVERRRVRDVAQRAAETS